MTSFAVSVSPVVPIDLISVKSYAIVDLDLGPVKVREMFSTGC
jgi:hypothetical protein